MKGVPEVLAEGCFGGLTAPPRTQTASSRGIDNGTYRPGAPRRAATGAKRVAEDNTGPADASEGAHEPTP